MSVVLFRIAAALCFLAVALGAFGAHSLRSTLEARGMLDAWNKAVFYQFIHAIALLVLALYGTINRGACLLLLMGILLFSGSLYLLALTNLRWLGPHYSLGRSLFPCGVGVVSSRTAKIGAGAACDPVAEPVCLLNVTQKNYFGGLVLV